MATAPAVASPLNLFIQQCLQFKPTLSQLDTQASASTQAVQFEQLTLGFNNINDRLNYYRDLAQDNQRESILMCQLHLADELQAMLNSPNLTKLISKLDNDEPTYAKLSLRLATLKATQLDINLKSQLHNAQATIRRNLQSQHLSMVFNQSGCELPQPINSATAGIKSKETLGLSNVETNARNKKDFDISLAKYLILQPDEQCRKSAWIAYQTRAKDKNKTPLAAVKTIKMASNAAKPSIYSAQYYDSNLTSAQITRFLNSRTNNINVAPWNIGQYLATLPHQAYQGTTSALTLIEQSMDVLSDFGVTFDVIKPYAHKLDNNLSSQQTNNVNVTGTDTDTDTDTDTESLTLNANQNTTIRVWHNKRLLGELFIHPSEKTATHIIRYPVIGHQFAQVSISYREKIKNRRQALSVIDAIAQAISGLARGSQFYLNNKFGASADHHQLGQHWLSQYIQLRVPHLQASAREQAASVYQQQLRVFRSQLIMQFYSTSHLDTARLHNTFYNSFNSHWYEAADLTYSFNGIANEGIEYYLPLWYQALVNVIIHSRKSSVTARQVFEIFIVNEDNLILSEQLAIILAPPTDISSIIRRTINDGNSKD
ncbi:hypothetical protein A9267_03210 [Shewanella sp. UCD-FRSSP16_17]|uniref:hypothetical protein n=1 Tax=Shewanella sp. UCD-FRSSP16_17 TaxID=1853256 RepID=UPI0007EEEA56|nr:hypothetical protein [Shewanella sp. UCD-FRSSP16_17]OBT11644.1 hypothetical protein A9267_03210 [Shewanella sp. UCD-FRSSP16_17]